MHSRGNKMLRAGAILVLLSAGDLDSWIEASTRLKAMLYNPDPKMREGAAYVLGAFKTGWLKKELQILLEDTNENVCINAILALDERLDIELAEKLVSKLGYGRVSYFARRTLVKYGTSVIPYLVKTIRQHTTWSARTKGGIGPTCIPSWVQKDITQIWQRRPTKLPSSGRSNTAPARSS